MSIQNLSIKLLLSMLLLQEVVHCSIQVPMCLNERLLNSVPAISIHHCHKSINSHWIYLFAVNSIIISSLVPHVMLKNLTMRKRFACVFQQPHHHVLKLRMSRIFKTQNQISLTRLPIVLNLENSIAHKGKEALEEVPLVLIIILIR